MHEETHSVTRISWLRAAILGANDGIVSTASLIAGVSAAGASEASILIAGSAGLVAGAMSMAAGEYVSVRSQADTEKAELARERSELKANIAAERRELAAIYVARGVEPGLAQEVADQLMAFDALGAHARDELGITEPLRARPVQAAAASAAAFAVGASVPLVVLALAPADAIGPYVATACLFALASLGAVSARLGGASTTRAALRIAFWGAAAMAVTSGIGWLVGTVPL